MKEVIKESERQKERKKKKRKRKVDWSSELRWGQT